METNQAGERITLEDRWRERERAWARKLGRLRLGVEPLDVQLARYRRVTWVLTLVSGAMSLMFLTLFSAFGRLDIGLLVAGFLFVPVGLLPWIGYRRLKGRASAYLAEQSRFEVERDTLTRSATEPSTASQTP
jgi:hypothetical protein